MRNSSTEGAREKWESVNRSANLAPQNQFVQLSDSGGDRATAYVMNNKIVRCRDNLLCSWLDSSRQNRWAVVNPETRDVVAGGAVGPERKDNHCGAALATAPDGAVHLVVGAHFGQFIHYRMSEDTRQWKKVREGVGDAATYPSIVCDQKGTLHLTYRCEPNGRDARLHYSRRPRNGSWSALRPLAQSAVGEHSWMTNAIEIGPDGRLHVVLSNTLPVPGVGPEARYYGASHLYSDDSGETWRQFGMDRALDIPVHGGDLERIEGDKYDSERVEEKYDGEPGPQNSYYHKILLSNPAVDEEGRPWVVVHNILKGEASLYHYDEARGWVAHPLLDAVQALLPELRVRHCGQVSRHRDGLIETVLMASSEGKTSWGAPGTIPVRLLFDLNAQIQHAELVRPVDPEVAQWLPGLERFCWHNPVDRPALLYTRGVNAGGYTHNKNAVNTEVWLQIP